MLVQVLNKNLEKAIELKERKSGLVLELSSVVLQEESIKSLPYTQGRHSFSSAQP